jgi:hypothetical protein
MAQAYMTSGGKEREAALGKVKAGYKECSHNMCALEAQIDLLMGSLEMRMKGSYLTLSVILPEFQFRWKISSSRREKSLFKITSGT